MRCGAAAAAAWWNQLSQFKVQQQVPRALLSTAQAIAFETKIIKESVLTELEDVKLELLRDKRSGSRPGRVKKRRRLPSQWYEQYLSDNAIYSHTEFRARFGVPRAVFDKLLRAIGNDIKPRPDGSGMVTGSSELFLLYTLRRVRTGNCADQFDDQTGIAPSTLAKKFNLVVAATLKRLAPQYLSLMETSRNDVELARNAENGWPGCFGSYDGMHVKWAVPKRAQAVCKGRLSFSNLLVMAVAHHDLYCSSLLVTSGAMNDLNAVEKDPLHGLVMYKGFGAADFHVPGIVRTFQQQYALGDGIFNGAPLPWIISAYIQPVTESEKIFTKAQESRRKDVERLFGVVQARFKIVRSGNRLDIRSFGTATDIIRFCF